MSKEVLDSSEKQLNRITFADRLYGDGICDMLNNNIALNILAINVIMYIFFSISIFNRFKGISKVMNGDIKYARSKAQRAEELTNIYKS